MVEIMRRGEIWVANLNPGRGREIGKIRPVLVLQADELSAIGTPMIVILPVTTQVYPDYKTWRVPIRARGRLLVDCQVVVEQPRALDRDRFGEGPLTTLSEEEMSNVECAFLGVCGMAQYLTQQH
ncbi:MAG: MazF family transcriptional regulator [Gallionellales bacterium RIFCSPLOWO2_02_FULL_57_47]|nr:MAG: MazF family transcriptional regulator [Gallionellales bacterium RIFCSPLOWO2_02_FULL_57_47]OGT15852.1 MAG: MazF family transcriptional regulator [Gallionellales bacterium RIFCSPHIGHO2_02_FULL_57_16]